MSYQVLARKYRPRRFEELVGQEHVQKALKNALDNDRLHHAYLFTGTRGVGKTTIARILSRCLNCETGVGSNPCGQCATCREIDEGRFVDLIEVDAASRTKVEDTRELLDNVQYAPTRGRYKVYLIDEVHMLSAHSFNALLKTLEEPPPHVKFLLATTDPQKLPVTVLSRCLQFNLKAMTAERIVAHLKDILAREGITFDEGALWELARGAQGSMRDALSLTDQAIAHGNGGLVEDEVRAMLGTVDRQYVWKIAEALAGNEPATVLASVAAVADNAPDWADVLAGLISLLHRVTVAQVVPEAIDDARGDRTLVLSLAERIPAADLQLFYQTALLGRRDLPYSPDARAAVEMTLLRMLAFRPAGTPVAGGSGGARAGGGDGDGAKKPEARPAVVPVAPTAVKASAASPVAAVPAAPTAIEVPAARTVPANAGPRDAPYPPRALAANEPLATPVVAVITSEPGTTSEPVAARVSAAAHDLPAGNLVALAGMWDELVGALEVPSDALALARNSALEMRDGDDWELVVAPGGDILLKEQAIRTLSDALSVRTGRVVKLKFVVRRMLGESPSQAVQRRAQERQAQAEEAIRSDPNVQDMIQLFGARILSGSIKPV
ncbi:MAG: DNA polymerase III subunit gamma/tau [Gammaproteobacteria bacterium]